METNQNTETRKPNNPRMQNFDGVYASDAYKSEDYVSLRDCFANSAMQGICTNAGRNGFNYADANQISEQAYLIADAMLKQREIENL